MKSLIMSLLYQHKFWYGLLRKKSGIRECCYCNVYYSIIWCKSVVKLTSGLFHIFQTHAHCEYQLNICQQVEKWGKCFSWATCTMQQVEFVKHIYWFSVICHIIHGQMRPRPYSPSLTTDVDTTSTFFPKPEWFTLLACAIHAPHICTPWIQIGDQWSPLKGLALI